MAILTIIDGVPLYSTINEAINNGQTFRSQGYNPIQQNGGYSGYHVHKHNNVTGYMAGNNHAETMPSTTVTYSASQTVSIPTQSTPTQSTYTPPTSTPSSGGGGGY